MKWGISARDGGGYDNVVDKKSRFGANRCIFAAGPGGAIAGPPAKFQDRQKLTPKKRFES
ncbi:MAG: hypothetical protein AAB541_04090 [Patescibacteria group bacterium]